MVSGLTADRRRLGCHAVCGPRRRRRCPGRHRGPRGAHRSAIRPRLTRMAPLAAPLVDTAELAELGYTVVRGFLSRAPIPRVHSVTSLFTRSHCSSGWLTPAAAARAGGGARGCGQRRSAPMPARQLTIALGRRRARQSAGTLWVSRRRLTAPATCTRSVTRTLRWPAWRRPWTK
eukprot:COSAG01_NODE_652_length_14497_cov_38.547968_5_plen_175_part_00